MGVSVGVSGAVSSTRRSWIPGSERKAIIQGGREFEEERREANSEKTSVLFVVLEIEPAGRPLLRRLVTRSELASHREGSPTRLLYPPAAARIGSRYGEEHPAVLAGFA